MLFVAEDRLVLRRRSFHPAGSNGEKLIVKSELLAPGDPVLIDPVSIQGGAAIEVTGGLDEKSLARLTLDAALAAVNEANPEESMRFVSPGYSDPPPRHSTYVYNR